MVRRLLVGVGEPQERRLVPGPPEELQAGGQRVAPRIAHRYRDRRCWRKAQPSPKVDDKLGVRLPVPLDTVNPAFLAATIATEDANFFTNPGVNPKGLARATWENFSPFAREDGLLQTVDRLRLREMGTSTRTNGNRDGR